MPMREFANFAREIELTPQRFHPALTDRLLPKSPVTIPVMSKWKVILFGLDFDFSPYVNCLGYPESALIQRPTQSQQDENANLK